MIDEIWMFCSVDEGGEGIIAIEVDGTMVPLLAADKARVDAIRGLAKSIGVDTGQKIVLKRFSKCEIVEEIT